jgi:hypothetical protein
MTQARWRCNESTCVTTRARLVPCNPFARWGRTISLRRSRRSSIACVASEDPTGPAAVALRSTPSTQHATSALEDSLPIYSSGGSSSAASGRESMVSVWVRDDQKRRERSRLRRAATTIQSWWRAERCRISLRLQQRAATRLQAAIKGWLVRIAPGIRGVRRRKRGTYGFPTPLVERSAVCAGDCTETMVA